VENRFIRQSGLIDGSIFATPICVIGAGGIGSFTTLALAKIGFTEIHIWDYDIVEEHNLPSQFYPMEAVDRYKVDALYDMIYDFTHVQLTKHEEWNKHEPLTGVVVSAVDSMDTRREIFNAITDNPEVRLFVDGRMGGNQLEIYTCNTMSQEDKRRYSKTLCSDEEAANTPCTERAVMYNVLTIGSWITNQIRLVLSDKEYKREMILDMENMMLLLPEERKAKRRRRVPNVMPVVEKVEVADEV